MILWSSDLRERKCMKPNKTYKLESFNQTLFCFEITLPDYIKVWREDFDGKVDDWWTMNITPERFHWLVDEWNNGNIAKYYPHWWQEIDTRKKHITNLIQLDLSEFEEALDYFASILPHKEWIGDSSDNK